MPHVSIMCILLFILSTVKEVEFNWLIKDVFSVRWNLTVREFEFH